jgi:hypothetical protein
MPGGVPIPVICDDCQQIWIADSLFGVSGGGAIHVTMTNTTVSPCPRCGGTGHTLDGVYEISRDAVRIFTRLPIELRIRLGDEVRKARDEVIPQDALADRIDALAAEVALSTQDSSAWADEVSRDVQALASEVRRLKQTDWRYWLMFAATALSSFVGSEIVYQQTRRSTTPVPAETTTVVPVGPMPEREVDRMVDDVLRRLQASRPTTNGPPSKVGRNAQCPCGSGRKFKQCHGR